MSDPPFSDIDLEIKWLGYGPPLNIYSILNQASMDSDKYKLQNTDFMRPSRFWDTCSWKEQLEKWEMGKF